MGLDNLQQSVYASLDKAKNLLGNPVAAAVGGAVVGAGLTGAVVAATRSRKKSRRKASRPRKRKSPVRRKRGARRRTYKYARTAGKRKDRSSRRIRMTKNGQPYIILKSGKARFISKRSARTSRRRKGGRY